LLYISFLFILRAFFTLRHFYNIPEPALGNNINKSILIPNLVRFLEMDHDWIGNGVEFLQSSRKMKHIGAGSDGIVELFQHKTGRYFVVKRAQQYPEAIENLHAEVRNIQKLGIHPNIIKMIGFQIETPPALFLEYANYGDMGKYSEEVFCKARARKIPEATVWKAMLDLSKGIDYLHNQLGGVPYCHGDIKPLNIFVTRPGNISGNGVRLLPTFKIGDLGRMKVFDPNVKQPFHGTSEYAPPLPEREHFHPAVDIWGIAASISELVFRTIPVESQEDFIKRYNASRDMNPEGHVLRLGAPLNQNHRYLQGIRYRPLNVTKRDQIEKHDIRAFHAIEPYSDALNAFYELCYNFQKEKRVTADTLQKYLVPTAERNVELYTMKYKMECQAAIDEAVATNHEKRSRGLQAIAVPLYIEGFIMEPGYTPARPHRPFVID
jgi:serine/threonine protein kinase